MSSVVRQINRRALLAFLGVFALLIIIGETLMVVEQRRLVTLETRQSFENELALLGNLALDSLLRGDYVAVERLVGRWGASHEDIGAIVVTAANGFTLARYVRAVPVIKPLRVEKAVVFEGREIVLLQADRELPALETQIGALAIRFTFVMLALLLVFGWMLWAVLHRTAIMPLEREIAAHKRAQDELTLRGQKIEAVNRDLEAFSYAVAHDLRAPLRTVNGFSAIVLKANEGKLDAASVRHLERIVEGAERMGNLIDALLNLARLSRQAVRWQYFKLSDSAANVVASLTATHPQRNVAVTIQPDMNAHGDPGLIGVVLDNLIGNAWKFTAKTSAPRIEVGTEQRDGQTVYYVRDNGAGFDMAYAHKLFAPFQRLHQVNEFEGTGIGLATVKNIIERHGGKIWVESAVNLGTTVFFTIGTPA